LTKYRFYFLTCNHIVGCVHLGYPDILDKQLQKIPTGDHLCWLIHPIRSIKTQFIVLLPRYCDMARTRDRYTRKRVVYEDGRFPNKYPLLSCRNLHVPCDNDCNNAPQFQNSSNESYLDYQRIRRKRINKLPIYTPATARYSRVRHGTRDRPQQVRPQRAIHGTTTA